jgi:hypothetical protein
VALININPPPGTLIGTYEETFTDLNAAAGTVNYDFATVPAGQVWVIEGGAAWNVQRAATFIEIAIRRGGTAYAVYRGVPTAALGAVAIANSFCLFPGDNVRIYWGGCVLNDDINGRLVGVKYGIELF